MLRSLQLPAALLFAALAALAHAAGTPPPHPADALVERSAATQRVRPDDSAVGMPGSGLVIVNPPWQLDVRLETLLPELHRLLAPDGGGGTHVEWLAGE